MYYKQGNIRKKRNRKTETLKIIRRLTPLLVASNKCMVSVVEHVIKRPEITKEERVTALELLGASLAVKKSNLFPESQSLSLPFQFMKRGLEVLR